MYLYVVGMEFRIPKIQISQAYKWLSNQIRTTFDKRALNFEIEIKTETRNGVFTSHNKLISSKLRFRALVCLLLCVYTTGNEANRLHLAVQNLDSLLKVLYIGRPQHPGCVLRAL